MEDASYQHCNMHFSDENRLDLEFRQILNVIRRDIVEVNSPYHLNIYRAWLERLNNHNTDKEERNRYLLELARQIKSHTVAPPFDQQPPSYATRNFPLNYYLYNPQNTTCPSKNTPRSLLEEFSENSHPTVSLPHPLSYIYPSSSNESAESPRKPLTMDRYYYYELEKEMPKMEQRPVTHQRRRGGGYNNPFVVTNARKQVENVEDYTNLTENYYRTVPENVPSQPDEITPKQKKRKSSASKAMDSFVCNDITDNSSKTVIPPDATRSQQTLMEDNSWCDLTTDGSASSVKVGAHGSGDGEKNVESNIQKIENDIEGPKLNGGLERIANKKECEWKSPLKDTKFISSDWKNTMEALQLRLTETLNQNNELKLVIDSLKAELKFAEMHKEKYEKERKKFHDLHQNEIEAMRTSHEEHIKVLEKSLQSKLTEAERNFTKKSEDIRLSYETKIEQLKLENYNCKLDKEKEIQKLTEIIQEQCTRMSNEISSLRGQLENTVSNSNSEERVNVLKKCVSKMDRLFHKSEKEYMKQIEELKQELKMKDKLTEIQLRNQRTQLLMQAMDEKERQFNEVINNMEVKYIKMLEHHEIQVAESKSLDEEKINYLQNLLDQNNIHFTV